MTYGRALLTIVLAAAFGARLGASASARSDADAIQVVPGARIAAIADRIAHDLVRGPDRSIASAYGIADQSLPEGTITLAPAGSPLVTPTYVSVPVAIRIGGKTARTVVAGYRVTTYVQTAVAARDLVPGAVIAPGDVRLARVAAQGRPAVGVDALLGRRINAAAATGAALYVEQTVPDTIVKAGQAAILVVHDGPVALTADVVARTGGALGDTVTVVDAHTRTAIAATVTGPNRVELTLPQGAQQ